MTIPNIQDCVAETTSTIGVGPLQLTGPITGFSPFSPMGNGDVYYTVQDGFDKEIGVGTLDADAGILHRTKVIATIVGNKYSSSATPLDLSGNAEVFCTVSAALIKQMIKNTSDNADDITNLMELVTQITGDLSGFVTKDALANTNHNTFKNRDATNAHPAISIETNGGDNVEQALTKSISETLAGPIYPVNYSDTIQNGWNVPAGTMYLRIPHSGGGKVVTFSPMVTGLVSNLTPQGCTIGNTNVRFLTPSILAIDKQSALASHYEVGTVVEIISCNYARFEVVPSSDTGGLYLGTTAHGHKLRHTPKEGFLYKHIRTSDFDIPANSDISQFLLDAKNAGYYYISIDDDYTVNSKVDITGVRFMDTPCDAELTIDDANGGIKSDTDDLEISGIGFKKSGAFSDTTYQNYLLEANGENVLTTRCKFRGQWAGYKLQGNNAKVDLCFFADGTFMLRVGEGVTSCRIENSYFTRGTRKYTEGEQQGDGIKLTAQSVAQGYNENIIISNNIFFGVYRDCIDGYVGANRALVSGNIMLNFGAHALDFKSRVDDNHESPDGGPLTRNVLVEGNIIWKSDLRPDFDLTLAAIVMSVIPGNDPLPTSEADVRAKGLRGMIFRGNRVACKGKGSFISATSTWATVIDDNVFTDLGDIGQIIYAPNCWHLKFTKNVVSIDPSNTNSVKFSLSMNKASINDNEFNRLLIATDGITNSSLKRNKFNGEKALSRGLNLSSVGISAVDNEFEGFTAYAAQIFGSAEKCRFDYNEIRDCPAPLAVSSPGKKTYNTVRGNLSLGSGAFTGLHRIVDNGGVASGNDFVDYTA